VQQRPQGCPAPAAAGSDVVHHGTEQLLAPGRAEHHGLGRHQSKPLVGHDLAERADEASPSGSQPGPPLKIKSST